MAVGFVKARKLMSALTLSCLGVALISVRAVPVTATDADVYVVAADAKIAGDPLGLTPTARSYSIDIGQCVSEGPFPGYVDVSKDDGTGPCTNVGGGGGLSLMTSCTSGLLTAAWTLTEPSGDVSSFTGRGVLVGGLMVVAASTLVGSDGYRDPSTSSSPGDGVAVGVMLPALGQQCALGGVSNLTVAATIVGGY